MSVVKATENTKYFGRKSSPVRDGLGEGEGVTSTGSHGLEEGGKPLDRVDLSSDTLEILKELKRGFDAIFRSFPRYKNLITNKVDKPASQAAEGLQTLSFLTQARRLLDDEHYQKLAQRDPEFQKFFETLQRFGLVSQEALSESQNQRRAGANVTYSRPR